MEVKVKVKGSGLRFGFKPWRVVGLEQAPPPSRIHLFPSPPHSLCGHSDMSGMEADFGRAWWGFSKNGDDVSFR